MSLRSRERHCLPANRDYYESAINLQRQLVTLVSGRLESVNSCAMPLEALQQSKWINTSVQ